jgi:O-antigen ligase
VFKNLRTLEVTRRFVPFVIIVIAVNLLVNGRVQNGAGYQGTLQLGDAHHGSFTSQLCSIGIYLFITLFSKKVNIITRVFVLSALAGIGTTIMLMGSRNGLMSFAILCGLGFFINLKGKRIDFQFIMVIVAMIAGVITILVSLNSPTIQRAIYMTEVASGGDRVYYWEAGATALEKHPIFGLGGDESASQGAVARYAPAVVQDKVMHNTYLEMAVEYGIFGFIFYLTLVFFVFTWGYRLYKFALQKQNMLIVAPVISYVILMIAAMFISDIWDTAIWYNMSIIFALAIQLVYVPYTTKRRINTFSSFQHQLAQSHLRK